MSARHDNDAKAEGAREFALPLASIVFAVGYSLLVLTRPSDGPLRILYLVLIFGSWLLLIASYLIRLLGARGGRLEFVRTHRWGLAAAILPVLGFFALLRSLGRIPGFRGQSGNALRSRIAVRAGGYAATFVYVIALTELSVERSAPHATIRTFGEAVWWACVTLATVGYGDYTPVTPLGRVVAVVLMAGGLVIIGTASALIVSYISERVRLNRPDDPPEPQSRDDAR